MRDSKVTYYLMLPIGRRKLGADISEEEAIAKAQEGWWMSANWAPFYPKLRIEKTTSEIIWEIALDKHSGDI